MSGEEPSDRELAEQLMTSGDPVAFHILYRRHTPALYAVARRLAIDGTDAEDAVHDAWLRVSGGLRRFHWESSLRTWLMGVLINRLRELRRGERPTVPLDDARVFETAVSDAPLPLSVDPLDLERAVTAMPVRYREVVLLHDLEGFTHEEIANLLGIELGTSKSQLARGRRWLRQALLPNGGETG